MDDADGDPMSVYRADVIEAEGGEPGQVMAGHAGFGLVAITAGTMRQKEQTVHPDPLPKDTAHTLICGDQMEMAVRGMEGKRLRYSDLKAAPGPSGARPMTLP